MRLPPKVSEKIDQMPESGMGFHLLDLITATGDVLQARTVLNSELVEADPAEAAMIAGVVDVRPSGQTRLTGRVL